MHWITRELVPDSAPATPPGFTPRSEPLTRGLPHSMPFDQDLMLVLVVPTGVALTWRDADPAASVGRVPTRLVLRSRARGVLASVPLVAGRTYRGLGGRLDVHVRGWDLRAGSMRGPGDFGSRIDLDWRWSDRASDTFAPPPNSQSVIDRIVAANPYANLGASS